MKISKEMWFGILRHLLTAVGGGLATAGYSDQATNQQIIGGILAVIGVVASILAKKGASVSISGPLP